MADKTEAEAVSADLCECAECGRGEGIVDWVRDYGAPENGGVMYVFPDALIREMPSVSYA